MSIEKAVELIKQIQETQVEVARVQEEILVFQQDIAQKQNAKENLVRKQADLEMRLMQVVRGAS